MRHVIHGILVCIWALPALAQKVPFSIVHTKACMEESIGYEELANCIGASANICMDTPTGGSTAGTMGCINHELEFWDGLLNAHYRDLRAREKSRDADGGEPFSRADALRDMQRAWITYRDAKCDYARAQWGGGTGGGPATLGCQLRMTGEQAIYLRQMLEDY